MVYMDRNETQVTLTLNPNPNPNPNPHPFKAAIGIYEDALGIRPEHAVLYNNYATALAKSTDRKVEEP